jgi:hypothetical protein
MKSRTGALALALSAALLVGACGGDDEEQKKKEQAAAAAAAKNRKLVKQVTTQFAEAGDDACETITASFMKRQFEGEESRCVTIYQAEEDDRPKVAVGKVTVAGGKATAAATIGGEKGSAKLVMSTGGWKVDRYTPDKDNQKELPELRGTADAFLTAVRGSNGTVFCGLLSEEFAQELLKVSEGGVGKCAIGASKINFSSLQGKLRGVSVTRTEANGELRRGRAILSNGAILLMRKPEDRWVINNIAG